MKFMGKWIIWSHAATGYVVPIMLPGGPATLLYANSIMDINDAVYNIYGGPGEGELLLQANTLAGSPGCWLQCKADASDPTQSVIPTASYASVTPVTSSENSGWTILQYGSTQLYVNLTVGNLVFFQMMLGNPYPYNDGGDPNLSVTVKTQPLDTYKQSKSAVGADFSNIDFTGVNLSGIDFTNANFDGALMDAGTVLPSGTALRGAKFIGARLKGVSFEGCDLTGADFTKASLSGARFNPQTKLADAKFVDVDLSGQSFGGCDLTGANFSRAVLTGANLTGATFKGCTLDGAFLTNCTLTNTNFAGATLLGTHLEGATFKGTDLSKTRLAGAVFKQSDLTGVIANPLPQFYNTPLAPPSASNSRTSLAGCRLNQSLVANDWSMLDLTDATILNLSSPLSSQTKPLKTSYAILKGLNQNNLAGLSLQNAVFDYAVLDALGLNTSGPQTSDLTGASFIQASMHGTNLSGAILKGANMSGAQLGSLSQLFTLETSFEHDLDAGPSVDAALRGQFSQHGITLSESATLTILAPSRVWQLNDVGNNLTYTIRLETKSDNTQVLTVCAPAASASLVDAYMPDGVLTGANLYGALANGAQFYGSHARLDGSAILEEVEFNDANLSNVNLAQANLFGANLSGAQLFNAKFNKANLGPSANGVSANLSNANLQGADFTDAQLYGANLTNAAVAIEVPTTAVPHQGGVYLFSLPYAGDTNTLQQYTAELNAAASKFSLNPDGDQAKLQQYVSALKANNLAPLKPAFLEQQPPIILSDNARIQTVGDGDIWQIVDGAQSYTLWTDPDENGKTELYASPSLTKTQAAFHQNDMTLRWQASVTVDKPGQQWLLDNDSENPQNFSTGYVKFIVKLNGGVLDVYGSAVRIERLGDNKQLQTDTETCNLTAVAVTNMNSQTICPNGTALGVNQQGGVQWDTKWLRASAPPKPPTCVPTDYNWCPQTQTTKKPPNGGKQRNENE